MNTSERENFGSTITAVLAMAGSAIGLGNIWRFPYMMGQNGGAAFIVLYLLCVLFLAMPILLCESIIGRSTHQGTYGAMSELAPGTKWKWLGLLTVFSPLIILSYYSVVGGWSIEYLGYSVAKGFDLDISGLFGTFISSPWGPLACHTVFLLLTALIVLGGVKSGIEKFNNISMPALFVMIVVIAVYSMTLPGASEGDQVSRASRFFQTDGRRIRIRDGTELLLPFSRSGHHPDIFFVYAQGCQHPDIGSRHGGI